MNEIKDEIIVMLDYHIVSFRDSDDVWFTGIDASDFDILVDELVALFLRKHVELNNKNN